MRSRRYGLYGRIERPADDSDFDGGTTPPTVVCNVYVALQRLAGFERVNATQLYAGANYSAFIRDPGVRITPEMRLVLGPDTYEIAGVVMVDREIELTMIGPNEAGGHNG